MRPYPIFITTMFCLFLLSCDSDFKDGVFHISDPVDPYPELRPDSSAHKQYDSLLKDELAKEGISFESLEVFLRAFKKERVFEVWVKDANRPEFTLFRSYDFCAASGSLGPKRKEGDYQVPEGLYHINVYNPYSQFHLSLGINYPNASDLKRSHPTSPGGEIFFHGSCYSIGCIALTDKIIRELYVLAETGHLNGQKKLPVHIFPFRMNEKEMNRYGKKFPEHVPLWKELRPFYEHFEANKTVPGFKVDNKGKYLKPV